MSYDGLEALAVVGAIIGYGIVFTIGCWIFWSVGKFVMGW